MINKLNMPGLDDKKLLRTARMASINPTTANFQRMIKLLEARKQAVPLFQLRKRMTEEQNQMNYQNEYDGLRNLYHTRTILPANTIEYFQHRKQFLKSLGAKDTNFLAK